LEVEEVKYGDTKWKEHIPELLDSFVALFSSCSCPNM